MLWDNYRELTSCAATRKSRTHTHTHTRIYVMTTAFSVVYTVHIVNSTTKKQQFVVSKHANTNRGARTHAQI